MNLRTGLIQRAELLNDNGAKYHSDVVRFLSRPTSYPCSPSKVDVIETHMSLVFMAGDFVYKLKRPIRLDFLDNRSLAARRQSCENEISINQRLAPGVYHRVLPVTRDSDGMLALGGDGVPIDWLVVMQRLDNADALDRMIAERKVAIIHLEQVCDTLADFYRNQPKITISQREWTNLWREKIEIVRSSLTDPLFDLPRGLIVPPLGAIENYIVTHRKDIIDRLAAGRVVDGHGDLKPEHVYLGSTVIVIDRLEFDERLRWCDPFDEITFLGLECDRLGASWVAPRLVNMLADRLDDRPSPSLLRFYKVYRACMRARLMIEHMREEAPRTPEEWPRKAGTYLRLAATALPLKDQS